MEKRKEIIAFDVDGVIFDSTEECLVIAWNAHQELIGKVNIETKRLMRI